MTLEHDLVTDDLFGLLGTLPRPGWVVLDAARDRRFTGELFFETLPQARVYLDRGRIYLAERVTDPSLGARLVDAGALNAAQLEHGAMRIGGDEHLGRLFERVPSVDRHSVLITAELMTEECVGWLAHQRVDDLRATPYRHHPSGVHRWERAAGWVELASGEPLPAPDPLERPIEIASPEPLFADEVVLTDDMIRWDEPSWLDERPAAPAPMGEAAPPAATFEPPAPPVVPRVADVPPPTWPAEEAPETASEASDDWIDRLDADGLPEPGDDPLARPVSLPPLPVDSGDRFEVIWPSGEVDEQFDETDVADVDDHHPDLDRAGPTVRVSRPEPEPPVEPENDAGPAGDGDDITDDVVLAVRRAVASIESGAATSRRLLADLVPEPTPSRGVALPSRHAMRGELGELSPGVAPPPTRSVFDDVPLAVPTPESRPAPLEVEQNAMPIPATAHEPERTSALRRLIGSLRKR